MKDQSNPFFNMLIVLVIVLGLGFVVAYMLTADEAPEQTDTLGATYVGFSIESARENVLLIKNEGTAPIKPNTLVVLVNGRQVSYTQEKQIEQAQLGELVLPLVAGPCPVRVEVVGAFQIRSTSANMCVYYEDFNDDPQWNVSGVEYAVSDGVATFTNTGEVGVAHDRADVSQDAWLIEARMKGDTPELLFLQQNGTGYAFGVVSHGGNTTEAAFWKEDSKSDSGIYPWDLDPLKWYRYKISSEDRGIYFGKIWEDGQNEPAGWIAFLADATFTHGGFGVVLGAAGERSSVDYIKVYIPPPPS